MKKIIYFLLIIILLAGIAGGAYVGYKHFTKDKDEPTTETNILTESKDLLNNHASVTFGTGDSAWTISTEDKLEPIYIDDLRAPGKGLFIGKSYNGNPSDTRPALTDVNIDGTNLISISISGQFTSSHINYALSRENDAFIWQSCDDKIYENVLYACRGESYDYDTLEATIKSDGYKNGDNYLLGYYAFMLEFKNIAEYGESSSLTDLSLSGVTTVVAFNIPVYYRVK